MVTRYAMVPELGHVTYDNEPIGMLGPGLGSLSRRDYSDETAREIDGAVRRIVDQSFVWARAILDRNRSLLEEGARTLLEKETLAEAELATLFGRVVKENGAPTRAATVTPPPA